MQHRQISVFFLRLVAMSNPSVSAGRTPRVRKESKLPIEIAADGDVITKLYATLDPCLSSGFKYRAPMSARAVAVIRPAPSSCLRRRFLVILSGLGQLHACRHLFPWTAFPGKNPITSGPGL